MQKFNKAYVALVVSFIAATLANFTGIEMSAELQAAIVSVVTAGLVFLVPNKA